MELANEDVYFNPFGLFRINHGFFMAVSTSSASSPKQFHKINFKYFIPQFFSLAVSYIIILLDCRLSEAGYKGDGPDIST